MPSDISREFAPAKINLALHLRRRRADGYHDLETIFAFADFGDTLTAVPAETLSLTLTGPFAVAAGAGADNLVLRAARALAAAAGVRGGATLVLAKHVPVAAGLGGGSADAAAALRLLSRLWGLDWSLARLETLASALGSDVPACVASRTCFGSGRGEALALWPETMSGKPLLLVNPHVAVPTGPVFAGWDRIDRGGISQATSLVELRNDMTAAAVRIAPVIGDVLAALATTDPVLARMSGSGATCLALYADTDSRDRAAATLMPNGWWQMATSIR